MVIYYECTYTKNPLKPWVGRFWQFIVISLLAGMVIYYRKDWWVLEAFFYHPIWGIIHAMSSRPLPKKSRWQVFVLYSNQRLRSPMTFRTRPHALWHRICNRNLPRYATAMILTVVTGVWIPRIITVLCRRLANVPNDGTHHVRGAFAFVWAEALQHALDAISREQKRVRWHRVG